MDGSDWAVVILDSFPMDTYLEENSGWEVYQEILAWDPIFSPLLKFYRILSLFSFFFLLSYVFQNLLFFFFFRLILCPDSVFFLFFNLRARSEYWYGSQVWDSSVNESCELLWLVKVRIYLCGNDFTNTINRPLITWLHKRKTQTRINHFVMINYIKFYSSKLWLWTFQSLMI